MIVKQLLNELDLNYIRVELGSADVIEDLSKGQIRSLSTALKGYGLELIADKRIRLIERIKALIAQFVHYTEEPLKVNFSEYLSEKLDYDYTYLANIFSEVEGITIEQFIIAHKIEKVKELLIYDELSIKEISFKLQYSSVAHLSNQFKKVTGFCPSQFKQIKKNGRLGLATLSALNKFNEK
ncbi:helix-turn-helix domain-containing protein [Mucilaginibacter litoreus]|uniref:Helix-turn-helix domain-containing protein n=1 Tax=Mucilaginibacter litoreus TaxID=1048221 RepID=A0ABW3AWV6_9SPHI